jgi:hypothetical protein
MPKSNITEVLRDEIAKTDLNLKQIAARADVDYQHLQRWYSHKSELLNALVAESVYHVLTGKLFTDGSTNNG